MTHDAESSYSKDLPAPHVQTKQEQDKEYGEALANPSTTETASSSSSFASSSRPIPAATISRLLKGKEQEWDAIRSKTGPLHLLDLPVDILRLIVKEVSL
jgi:hypothetical protein